MSGTMFVNLNDRCGLGARTMAAWWRHRGHEAYLLNFGEYDHNAYTFSETPGSSPESFHKLRDVLDEVRPAQLGISYRSSQDELARAVTAAARAAVPHKLRIIAGGIGATSDPKSAAEWADLVCVGEGDALDFEAAKGVGVWQGPLLADLNTVPLPDYAAEATYSIVRGQVTHPDGRLDNDIGAYPLLTSRGCPRHCSYCHNSCVQDLYPARGYCRQKSVAEALKEIIWARSRWDVKLLSIYDDCFIANPEWTVDFCRYLRMIWRDNPRWWCMAHPAYIREDVIAACVSAGMEEICLGVQSGSPRVLAHYHRGTTLDEIQGACDILAKFPNLAVKIDLITADPRFDRSDDAATLDLLAILPMTAKWHPGLSRLTVFPGSRDSREITQGQCEALHGPEQDFVDGILRGAFQPHWRTAGVDFADAVLRYEDFERWCAERGFAWPTAPEAPDPWLPLTLWLDGGAPK